MARIPPYSPPQRIDRNAAPTFASLTLTSLAAAGILAAGVGGLLGPIAPASANQMLAGPASGAAAAPGFRALVIADLSFAGQASGVATLDAGGKVPLAQLPAISITETFVVASQAAMLALTAERGDVAVRTDLNKSFILSTDSPGTLADWKELLTPTDAVLSVAGLTGAISAASLQGAFGTWTATQTFEPAIIVRNAGASAGARFDSENTFGLGGTSRVGLRNLANNAPGYLALAGIDIGASSTRTGSFADNGGGPILWLGSSSITQDAANRVGIVNGVTAQNLRVYAYFVDPNNHRRVVITENGLTMEAAGTGVAAMSMYIGTAMTGLVEFFTQGTVRWQLAVGGTWQPVGTGLHDLGATALRVRAAYLGGNTVTASAPVIDIAQTWNNAGVTFKGIVANFTDTASAAASLLMDLQVGGVSQLSVSKAGAVRSGLGTAAAPGLSFGGATNAGLYADGSTLFFSAQGVRVGYMYPSVALVDAPTFLIGAGNVALVAEAANILALRSGPAAQTLNVYNTYTDGSNYERAQFSWAGNEFYISVDKVGTGSQRPLSLYTGSSGEIRFYPGAAHRWSMNSSGHLLAVIDNVYDIGASGATRPRIVYAAGSVRTNEFIANDGGFVYWSTRVLMASPADGVLTITNNAQSAFTGLLLGPSGTTYNRIKHGGAGLLQSRLADDSAFSSFQAKHRTHANAVAETPPATHTIAIEDAAGTAYKVLALAA